MLVLKLIHVSEKGPWWLIYASVNLVIIGSGDSSSIARRQTIIDNNAAFLTIRTSRIDYNEIGIKVQQYAYNKCIWICRL